MAGNWQQGLPLLVTSRVVLRELRSSDAPALARVARTPETARYAWTTPSNADGFDAFIKHGWSDRSSGRYACFAIVPQGAPDPAGVLELRSLQPRFFRAELGMLVDPALWGTPAFEDAVRLMCRFAVGTVGVHRIEIRTAAAYAACTAALEQIGIQREAQLRASFAYGGRFDDQYLWSIVSGLDRLAQAG